MHQAGLNGAGALVVVARVLMKERGEDRVSEEVAVASVGKLCAKAFGVSLSTLPVRGICVHCLLDSGADAYTHHGNGIECAACCHRKFLFHSERSSVMDVAGIEIWDDADQTLFLRSFNLLSSDKFVRMDRHLCAFRCDG